MRARPYAHNDWFDAFTTVRDYCLTPELASSIDTPLLVTDPEDEQFWPGQSRRLAELVGADAEVVAFSAAEGADVHCEPMARLLVDLRMFDWLDERLAGPPG
jgi:hypothetical protein